MTQEYGNQSKSYLSRLQRSALNSFKAFSYQQLTINNTVQKLTIPTDAKYALIIVESSIATTCARYLETGQTTVAAGTGMPISNGTVFDVTDAQNLAGFQVIQEAAGTHKLNIQYYK